MSVKFSVYRANNCKDYWLVQFSEIEQHRLRIQFVENGRRRVRKNQVDRRQQLYAQNITALHTQLTHINANYYYSLAISTPHKSSQPLPITHANHKTFDAGQSPIVIFPLDWTKNPIIRPFARLLLPNDASALGRHLLRRRGYLSVTLMYCAHTTGLAYI